MLSPPTPIALPSGKIAPGAAKRPGELAPESVRSLASALADCLIGALSGRVDSVTVARPTLEDVFLHRTGRRLYGEDEA